MEDMNNMNDLLDIVPNNFRLLLYHDCGVIDMNHMPHICLTVNAADFVAYSMIPAPYFFGISSDGTEYERNRFKKKISAIVRQISVGEKSGGQLVFYNAPDCVSLITGVQLAPDAVKGISVIRKIFLPQEVIDKVCSYNSWERYDGLIYVKPEALQPFIYFAAKERVGLLQYGWIKSRIWYNEDVIPNGKN